MSWEPLIEPALRRAKGYDMAYVRNGVIRGDFQVWADTDAAIITEAVVSPRHKALNMWLGGGKAEPLRHLRVRIEQWAKAKGFTSIGATGRKGWSRALRADGYLPVENTVEKDL